MTPDYELIPEVVGLEKATVVDLTVAGYGETKQSIVQDNNLYEDLIPTPLSLDSLARLSQTSSVRRAIIEALARNTVGLGYSIALEEGEEKSPNDDGSAREKEIKQRLESLAARDTRLDSPSFTELLMAVKTDEEEVGTGYLEVSRNALTGEIDGLYHAPGKRMRRKRDGSGFVMLGPSGGLDEGVAFYHFGDKQVHDADGRPTKERKPNRTATTNELLPFRIYTSESRDYGLPRDVGLALEYAGDKLAAESNISFFDSSGTPPTIIFVQGEETNQGGKVTFKVPQQTVERIANTLKSDGGHRHRVGIIPLPPGSKTDSVQLGQISDRDMGFVEYRKDNKRRQLSAFRLSPIFLADTDDGGRYTAEVQRAISLEQIFDPEQSRYENRLHNTLMRDMGYGDRRIKFKRLAVEDSAARRDAAEKSAEVGAITFGEYRAAHNLAPLPEAAEGVSDEDAQKQGLMPHGWSKRLIPVQKVGPPNGADNRVAQGTDARGLRPGIGARRRKQETQYGSAAAEGGAASLAVATTAAGRAATQRGKANAASNGGG